MGDTSATMRTRNIRKGNDIAVIWSLMKDDEPFSFQGRTLKLYLKNMYGSKVITDFVVKGNQIHWTFFGKDQATTGLYSLTLVANENEEGMITTDSCDFVRLVSCSCKVQGGEDAPNVETETIELTSTLEYVANVEQGGSYDDTALWNALENKVDKVDGKELSSNDYTDEDKSKLARLQNYDDSELRDKIEEAINKSPIFEAIYGETTYDEIVNAKNEGKWVICKYGDTQYHLSVIDTSSAFFATAEGNTNKRVWCGKSSGQWYNAVYRLEQTMYKTTSLSSESTDTQYPSAKAVYDFVQDTLGTIINGDY